MPQILFEHSAETLEVSTPRFQMGFEHIKGLHLESQSRSINLPSLIFPREGSRLALVLEDGRELRFTSSQCVYVPAKSKFKILGISFLSRSFKLNPSESLFSEMLLDNKLSESLQKDLLQPAILRLSRWMDDLIDRYFFERLKNVESPVGCPQFLEKQIMNEFARLRFPDALNTTGKLLGKDQPSEIETLVNWIQAHLFDDIDLSSISKAAQLSESQVNRLFSTHLEMTPMAFVYNQRLEESARLIERAELTLTDIANIAGFSDQSAFSKAFKKKFKVTPGRYVEIAIEIPLNRSRPTES